MRICVLRLTIDGHSSASAQPLTNAIIKLKHGAPWRLVIKYKPLDELKQIVFGMRGEAAWETSRRT